MLHDVISLMTPAVSTDAYGREIVVETERVVFAEVESISQSEFFAAADTELNPEFRFKVFFGDYRGEEILVYLGVRYSIYRTFRSGDYMELYAERKIGA